MNGSRHLALITGGSSGIGATFARSLARRQYDLILVARRIDRLEQLRTVLAQEFGIAVEAFQADLSREVDVMRVAERIEREAELDLLVNNAGFGTSAYFFQADRTSQVQMHAVHVLATMILTHAALKGMVQRRKGGIINVSSVAGSFPSPRNVSYNSTKAWMNTFTEAIYLELRTLGIPVKVQALCPGFTYTEFHDRLHIDKDDLYKHKSFWMKAEDVVEDSLRGLEEGRWRVIPGWRYRFLVHVLEYLPDFLRQPLVMRARYKPVDTTSR